MTIAIIGENCSGKSTLAEALAARLGAEILSGMDYLRLAKSPSEAEALFRAKLTEACDGANLIYVIAQPEQLAFLPDGAIRILVKADLETIQARFRARMRGNLPPPVAQMLERRHGVFDNGQYDYVYDGVAGDPAALCAELAARQEADA